MSNTFIDRYVTNLSRVSHISGVSWLVLAIISIGSYALCFTENETIAKYRRRLNRWCPTPCTTEECCKLQQNFKGSHYNIDEENFECTPLCPFGIYEIGHVFFHIIVGYYFNIWYSLMFGVIWEVIEHTNAYDCASIFDVGYNTAGGLIGVAIRTATE